ncbi:MAG: hypothetical protein AB7E79_12705 [Rhodospirillaceae bacterium]
MAKRQQSRSMTKETSGTRGRSNMNKSASKSSNNRRTAARVADNPDEQMQSANPSDGSGGRNGRSRSGKQRTGTRSKKNQSRGKTTAPKRTRSAR